MHACMSEKKCNHSGAQHQYFKIFFKDKNVVPWEKSYLLNIEKDTLILITSGEEFHGIIPL